MADVFISYSRRDTAFVRQLFEALKQQGREAWVDWQGIDYSTRWWEEICQGIERADNFVLVISPDSLTSEYCQREIAHARQHNKRIIPFVYREVDEKALAGEWYKQPYETLA
ncbi:MAG: toll/interleukin-1 receptor domain-containing protein, partial [Anaerolineae bacterium]|nr:toll/interleukin-1 receptor domain-containing protein [Anaerolineae bacterium]